MREADLVIINARQLVTFAQDGPLSGRRMAEPDVIEGGAVAVLGDKIEAVGTTEEIRRDYRAAITINASGHVVSPGLVDCHTHAVFVGSREDEFAMRMAGKSYMEIARAGGGIARTTRAVRKASREELFNASLARLRTMLAHGTTTAEVKSGYGLRARDEMRMLDVAAELDAAQPIDVVRTFMGAHAVPPEYKGRQSEYVSAVVNEMMPLIEHRNLAEFCDVFCEPGAFTVEESREILTAGLRIGLRPKIHAEELCHSGGAALAAEIGAVSAEHLTFASDEDLAAMAAAGTVGVLLPGTSYSLGDEHLAPARGMIEAGVPVAIATDLNPGSCMTESLQIIVSFACTRYGLTPAEALAAATINAAWAVGRGNTVGSLRRGFLADVVMWDVPSYQYLPYHFGVNHAALVIKRGKVVWRRRDETDR